MDQWPEEERKRAPSRWGERVRTRTALGEESRSTEESWRQYVADVKALVASKHTDPRPVVDGVPQLQPGERWYFRGHNWHILEVEGYGYRMLMQVYNGTLLAWELPGYNGDDAYHLCYNLAHGNLDHVPGPAPSRRRESPGRLLD